MRPSYICEDHWEYYSRGNFAEAGTSKPKGFFHQNGEDPWI